MNRAATTLNQHPEFTPTASPAPADDAWLHDPVERGRRIQTAQWENARRYKLTVAFMAMWRAENAGPRAPAIGPGYVAPESADMLAELARRCRVVGNLNPQAVEAFVAVAEACGVTREQLRASFRDLVSEDVA